MKKMLVFGGTRFFGKKVVDYFLKQGFEITLATRGQTPDSFGEQVNRITVDRSDPDHPGWQTIGLAQWEVVFDNICYNWQDAQIALNHIQNVNHYLLTSSLAVYQGDARSSGFKESDFNQKTYDYNAISDATYGEGKRQSEAYFQSHAPFPVTFLRFPVVLDEDDYTKRLDFYIEQVLQNKPLVFRRSDGLFTFVKASEIPLVLAHIVDKQLTGPLNISSSVPFTTQTFTASLSTATEQAVTIELASENISPFSHYDSALDLSLLAQSGYKITTLDSWLPDLMATLVKNS